MKRRTSTTPTRALLALPLVFALSCSASESMPREGSLPSQQSVPEEAPPAPDTSIQSYRPEPGSEDGSADSVQGGGAPAREESVPDKESVPTNARPTPAREPSEAPVSAAEATEAEESLFEGDSYDGPTERDEVEELVAKIRKSSSTQRGALADYDARAPRSCNEVCDLSEGICSSSTKICKIANSNPTESYFGDRCRWARSECQAADARCSKCSS